MKKKYILSAVILMAVASLAVVVSYAIVNGSGNVAGSVSVSFPGSGSYVLSGLNQGETKYQQITVDNAADVPINVSATVSLNAGSAGTTPADVILSLTTYSLFSCTDAPLGASMSVPAGGSKNFCVKHAFSPAANTGLYNFTTDIVPA